MEEQKIREKIKTIGTTAVLRKNTWKSLGDLAVLLSLNRQWKNYSRV